MSNDLKDPLSSIKRIAEQVSSKSQSKEITLQIERMENVIANAGTYSELTQGSFDSKKAVMELNQMVNYVLGDFEDKAKLKKIKLVNETEKSAQYFAFLLPMFKEVIKNLVDNAIKYSPEGSEVKVIIENKDEDTILNFIDQGKGIKDSYKELIFHRVQKREEGIEGSGLGLAISQYIVELHDGRIWVEDNPGGGSVFKVRLPVEK
jgi:signal transduction histidine kinase